MRGLKRNQSAISIGTMHYNSNTSLFIVVFHWLPMFKAIAMPLKTVFQPQAFVGVIWFKFLERL